MKHKWMIGLLGLSVMTLVACGKDDKSADTVNNDTALVQQIKAPQEDKRLIFNQIKLGRIATDFKGGSTIEEVKAMLGEPLSSEKVEAGKDIFLDSLNWQFDGVSITARFFENGAISKSISNFAFIRDAKISLTDFEAIPEEEAYQKLFDQFGQPDVMSESVSSDSEQVQAIWTSNLYRDKTDAFMELTFENKVLVKKVQNGLTEKKEN